MHTRVHTHTRPCISCANIIPSDGKNKITSKNAAKTLQHQQHLPWLINSGLNLLLSGRWGTPSSRHPPAIRPSEPGILTFYWFPSKAYVKKTVRSPKEISATNTLGEIQTSKNRKKDKMQIWVSKLKQPKPDGCMFKDKSTNDAGILFWHPLISGNPNVLHMGYPPLPNLE